MVQPVNRMNFHTVLLDIESHIRDADFIGIDLEFTALNPVIKTIPSDSASERYNKLRTNVSNVIPIEVGITTFNTSIDNYAYMARPYNFYVTPSHMRVLRKNFILRTDSVEFLKKNEYNFFEFVHHPIQFISREQENDLRNEKILPKYPHYARKEYSSLLDNISKWYYGNDRRDYVISKHRVSNMGYHYYDMLWAGKSFILEAFGNLRMTLIDNLLVLQRLINDEENGTYEPLKDAMIDNLLGFTKIIRLLIHYKKPLIGHNILNLLMLLTHHFETSLPQNYLEFKELSHRLFPVVYDTKAIAYVMESYVIRDEFPWQSGTLSELYAYFQTGHGSWLLDNVTPEVRTVNPFFGKSYRTGYDSYCTGYIFTQLAFLRRALRISADMFSPGAVFDAIGDLKNRVHISRGLIPYIFIYNAIPFITRDEEDDLRNETPNVEPKYPHYMARQYYELLDDICDWYYSTKDWEYTIPEDILYDLGYHYYDVLWAGKNYILKTLKNVRMTLRNNLFVLQKSRGKGGGTYEPLKEAMIDNMLGFTKIFRLLTHYKKPLIGHNILIDIMMLIHHFETPLPHDYAEFKELNRTLFPVVYDTKSISYAVGFYNIREADRWPGGTLSDLYTYFRTGRGFWLLHRIIPEVTRIPGNFHQAGYDSYCTGYIFIYLAFFRRYLRCSRDIITPNTVFDVLVDLKNRVNVIKGLIPYIRLDANDPIGRAPPPLRIESRGNEPTNLWDIHALVAPYGLFEMRGVGTADPHAVVTAREFSGHYTLVDMFQTNPNYMAREENPPPPVPEVPEDSQVPEVPQGPVGHQVPEVRQVPEH